MTVEFILHRLLFQSMTMIVFLLSIMIYVYIVAISGKFPSELRGIFCLSIHIVLFYTFVILDTLGIFSITLFVNGIFGERIMSFTLWSSAIRLQTSIEVLLMSLTVLRRYRWIKSATT